MVDVGTVCWAKRNLGVCGPNFESEVHRWADVVSLGVLLRKDHHTTKTRSGYG